MRVIMTRTAAGPPAQGPTRKALSSPTHTAATFPQHLSSWQNEDLVLPTHLPECWVLLRLAGLPTGHGAFVHTVAGEERAVWARECLVPSMPPWMR